MQQLLEDIQGATMSKVYRELYGLPHMVSCSAKDEAATIRIECPGIPKENISISLDSVGSVLNVKVNPIPGDWHTKTFRLDRSWKLTDRVDADAISSEYKDGVLYIRLPHRDPVKPRTIPVG
jgi:HSP20 family molecular chaperone IbpA